MVKELNLISGTGKKSGKPYVIANIVLQTAIGDYQINLDTFGDKNCVTVLTTVIKQLQHDSSNEFAEGLED